MSLLMTHKKNGNCTLYAWDEKTGSVIATCPRHGQPTGECTKCARCVACDGKAGDTSTRRPGPTARRALRIADIPPPVFDRTTIDQDVDQATNTWRFWLQPDNDTMNIEDVPQEGFFIAR